MGRVAAVFHGHFYQPPRENPWTEVVPREPTAAPFHDWNERITAECYRPNGWARVLDDQGRIVAVVDNYTRLSFDVGPTLLSWLDAHAPETYARIVAAERSGRRGMAQAYGHAILPLCNDRDLHTQIRWGLADFRHRFGREPEGMWLPETAVDDRVLAALADAGVAFTILAPTQIAAVRPLPPPGGETGGGGAGGGERAEADGRADGGADPGGWSAPPSGPGAPAVLRWRHPGGDGRGVDLAVYDGALAHDVAFGGFSSQAVVDRLTATDRPLVTVACDGETFGHHHHFADRGVAYALAVEAPRRGVTLPRLADRLAAHPPTHEARVHRSAWSCAHGVGRWMEDCGCHTGGEAGWTQAWRAPLRAALDQVRDAAVEVFERRGAALLRDPWAARDAYVDVLLGAVDRDAFVAEHAVGDPVAALTLLESQRHALLMYTSCGWFFHDLAGLETVQILRYAARCLDLLDELGESPPVDAVLDTLARARSNRPEEGDGRDVWRRHVVPSRVDPGRIVAHLALTELLVGDATTTELGGFAVERSAADALDRGGVAVCAGRTALTHRRTGRRTVWAYAAVHLGGLEVTGALRPGGDPAADADAVVELMADTRRGVRITELLRTVVDRFGPREIGLDSALPSEGGDVARATAAALADRFVAAYEGLRADHHDTLAALATAETALPAELRGPIEAALARRLETEVAESAGAVDPAAYQGVRAVARTAREEGVRLVSPRAARSLGRAVSHAVDRASTEVTAEGVRAALGMVDLARDLDVGVDLGVAQELVYDALRDPDLPVDDRDRLVPLARALGVAPEAGEAMLSSST